jgi:hypothetical protein
MPGGDPRSQTIRLTIDLDVGQDPIQGQISVHDGKPHQFQGWLELSSRVEAARDGSSLGSLSADRPDASEIP